MSFAAAQEVVHRAAPPRKLSECICVSSRFPSESSASSLEFGLECFGVPHHCTPQKVLRQTEQDEGADGEEDAGFILPACFLRCRLSGLGLRGWAWGGHRISQLRNEGPRTRLVVTPTFLLWFLERNVSQHLPKQTGSPAALA